jgi:tRNA (cytidine32/guanosine34-2'-O)-methyltransferase
MENIEEQNIDINEKDKTNFKNISYSKRDVYYRKAKEEGFRARSVYKLEEINNNFNILKGARRIVDLCAAPGSWSQMVRNITKATKEDDIKIVSCDIQDIVPIEGVIIVKGDITKQETISNILSHFNNEKVDVIIFDGAPDVTGLIDIDMYMQVQLIIFSLIICLKLLKKNGKFCAKVFKEEAKGKQEIKGNYSLKSDFYYEKAKSLFENVYYFKPASSRNTSHETYLICEGYSISDQEIENKIESMNIEEIYNYNNIQDGKVRNFLQFLCQGDYNI